jgi:hypothetical protein
MVDVKVGMNSLHERDGLRDGAPAQWSSSLCLSVRVARVGTETWHPCMVCILEGIWRRRHPHYAAVT